MVIVEWMLAKKKLINPTSLLYLARSLIALNFLARGNTGVKLLGNKVAIYVINAINPDIEINDIRKYWYI